MTITGKTKILAVIGYPVGHSLSPAMHNAAISALSLDCIYVPFEVEPKNVRSAVEGMRALQILGMNVTIPHKQSIIPCLDKVSETALSIGSVNTVINRGGKLLGDSTDGIGFLRSAQDVWGELRGVRALILGAGGSARAVCAALRGIDCDIVIANRTQERAAELAQMLEDITSAGSISIVRPEGAEFSGVAKSCRLIVNTTSVGMSPHPDASPIPAGLILPHHLVYDLVYNPMQTRLIQDAQRAGASAVGGLKMLLYQGAASFEMWTGIFPPVDVMEDALLQAIGAQKKMP